MSSRSPGEPPLPGQGIALRSSYFVLDWTLRFTRTTVVIDGDTWELPWGDHFFPLSPGLHQIRVSYRYLRFRAAGAASTTVRVDPETVVRIAYDAPRSVLLAFLPGKLTARPDEQP